MTTTTFTFVLPPVAPVVAGPSDGKGYGPEWAYNPAQVTDAESLLLSQFDDATKLHALLAALLGPMQELEDALAAHYAAFDVDTAEGVLLDALGAIVGEYRNGRGDSELRAHVKARVAANASDGSASAVYRVVRLVLGDELTLRIETKPPAYFVLYISGGALAFPWDAGVSSTVVAKALVNLVTDASSLGVGFGIAYQAADDAHTFTCASADAIESSSLQGCADDAQTTGGQLADVEGT